MKSKPMAIFSCIKFVIFEKSKTGIFLHDFLKYSLHEKKVVKNCSESTI